MHVAFTISDGVGNSIDVSVDSDRPVPLRDVVEWLGNGPGQPDDGASSAQLWHCAGRLVPATTLVGHEPVRTGSVVTIGGFPRRQEAASTLSLDVVSGPDSGARFPLRRGVHVVGRDPGADMIIADPGLSRRHFELEVDAHTVRLRDLASANGTVYDGCRVETDRAVLLATSAAVTAGNTRLQVRGTNDPPIPVRDADDGLLHVHRRQPQRARWVAPEFVLPARPIPDRARVAWLPILASAASAVVLAATFRSRSLLLVGAVGPLVMFLMTLTGRRAQGRQQRREQAALDRATREVLARVGLALREEAAHRELVCPDAAAMVVTATTPGCRLWERSSHDSADFLTVRLGLADLPANTVVVQDGVPRPAAVLARTPATMSLAEGSLGVIGSGEAVDGLCRWLVAQLAVLHSPLDLRLILLLGRSRSSEWRWLRWLPALEAIADSPAERQQVAQRLIHLFRKRKELPSRAPWTGPWVVVILDPASSVGEVSGLHEVIEHGTAVGISVLCVSRDNTECVRTTWAARFRNEVGTTLSLTGPLGTSSPVQAEQVATGWAQTVARALAPLRVDGTDGSHEGQPVSLSGLIGCHPLAVDLVRLRWEESEEASTADVSLGVAADGPFAIDLPADGPHLLVAGTTGSGKSELLRSLIAGHALRFPPSALSFILVDYKGGAAFAECAALPHVAGLVTDLDPHLARRALVALTAELRRREHLLSRARVADLAGYRRSAHHGVRPLSRLILVIDEFATLVEELPDFLDGMLGIAQRGRSLGMHLVLATQRPAGVVSPAIRANVGLRICLRVPDATDSLDVIGVPDAALIDSTAPGRAIARYSDGRIREFHAAYVSAPARRSPQVCLLDSWNRPRRGDDVTGPTELQQIRSVLDDAATAIPAVPKPWLEPLPAEVFMRPTSGSSRITLGVTDEPAEQRRGDLQLDLDSPEALAFLGSPRSGRTTALCTVVGLAAAQRSSDALHIYVIDCSEGDLRAFSRLPHCGAYLDSADPAAVATLLDRLLPELARRRAAGVAARDAQPTLLVAVDGWERFVALSEEHDGGRSVQNFLRLLREGPSVGISIVIAGDRHLLTGPIRSAVSRTLVLPLTDRQDYLLAGIALREVPGVLPPGRVIDVASGTEAQIGRLSTAGLREWLAEAVPPAPSDEPGPSLVVRSLPPSACLSDYPSCDAPARTGRYLLGIGGDEARPVWWEPTRDGNSLLIAGPSRSGKTHSLLRIAEQAWPAQPVTVAAPGGSALARWAAERDIPVITPGDTPTRVRATVLLVDDAQRFSNAPAGELLRSLHANATLAAVATSSLDLTTDFRGLTAELRRQRHALLLQPTAADAASYGIELPWRRSVAIPGRGILIDDTGSERGYVSIQVLS